MSISPVPTCRRCRRSRDRRLGRRVTEADDMDEHFAVRWEATYVMAQGPEGVA